MPLHLFVCFQVQRAELAPRVRLEAGATEALRGSEAPPERPEMSARSVLWAATDRKGTRASGGRPGLQEPASAAA